ncbi:hypothetical protein LJR219_002119 [Phenylobacterium sp. LjRoot219]|uniref:hypothetical protein n=1 Tax=Phenylobacterium sp. LjRoot219 TaxID=3342283 RepID=UPI003ECCF36C
MSQLLLAMLPLALVASVASPLMGLGAICIIGGVAILFMREKRGGHLTSAEREAPLEDAISPTPIPERLSCLGGLSPPRHRSRRRCP